MSTLKPINTYYKGYRFRSRLEARWAVFFDKAHIDYEYELEGFALPSGSAYLPDFYLPNFQVYVEIKPNNQIPLKDLKKIFEFSSAGDNPILLIVGTPTQENIFLIKSWAMDTLKEFEEDSDIAISDENITKSMFDYLQKTSLVVFGNTPLNKKYEWVLIYKNAPGYPLIDSALKKAKQARFEHGESN